MSDMDIKAMSLSAFNSFDIKKYSEASSMTVLDWRAVLRLRSGMYSEDPTSQIVTSPSVCASVIRRISDAPLSTLRLTTKAYGPSVADMSLRDAYMLREDVEDFGEEHVPSLKRLQELDWPGLDLALDEASDDEFDELLKKVGEAQGLERRLSIGFSEAMMEAGAGSLDVWYLEIDASAPDDVLIDDFKGWLAKLREKHGRVDPISESTLRRWAQHRVLPLIDLTILARLAGIETTNYSLGCMIFSDIDGVDVAEKIRKTTRPLADWIMNDGEGAIHAKANSDLRKLIGKNWTG